MLMFSLLVFAVRIFVLVAMFMFGRIILTQRILLPIHPNVRLGRRNSTAHYTRKFQSRANVQRSHGLLQKLGPHSGIYQCAKKHVAADAGKALKVRYPHRNKADFSS
jgi:hypothetical protein